MQFKVKSQQKKKASVAFCTQRKQKQSSTKERKQKSGAAESVE